MPRMFSNVLLYIGRICGIKLDDDFTSISADSDQNKIWSMFYTERF